MHSNDIFYLVIEVSCGEYGDNVRKLVTAIKNGKYDIQMGKPFPQPEILNNVNQKDVMKSAYFYQSYYNVVRFFKN